MPYEKIEKIRLKNNTNTLKILKLAFKYYPGESANIMKEINEGDSKISKLLKEFELKSRRSDEEILSDLEYLRAQNNTPWMKLYKLAHQGSNEEYEKLKSNSEKYSNEILNIEEEIWKLS
jgi:hypothetical protein